MYNALVQEALMVRELSVSEARKNFSGLIDEVSERDEEVVITRRGRPIARITKMTEAPENLYPLRGLGSWISDNFDERMDELWAGFLDDDLN